MQVLRLKFALHFSRDHGLLAMESNERRIMQVETSPQATAGPQDYSANTQVQRNRVRH